MGVVQFDLLHPRDRRGRFRKTRKFDTSTLKNEECKDYFGASPEECEADLEQTLDPLDDSDKGALMDWHAGDFRSVDDYLRNKHHENVPTSPYTPNEAEKVTRAMEKGEAPFPFFTHRYFHNQDLIDAFENGSLIGSQMTDDGPMATTLNDDIDPAFLNAHRPEDITRLEVRVPKGAHGIWQGGKHTAGFFSGEEMQDPDRFEFDLRPGTTVGITDAVRDPDTGNLMVYGDVIGQYADVPPEPKPPTSASIAANIAAGKPAIDPALQNLPTPLPAGSAGETV